MTLTFYGLTHSVDLKCSMQSDKDYGFNKDEKSVKVNTVVKF